MLHLSEIDQIDADGVGRKVVVGGCFDLLHIGHITFLKKAKEEGDILIVLLESDESIRTWKGENRPIHTQQERADILQALHMVDYVILLPEMKGNQSYDELVKKIHPHAIVTTKGDKGLHHKKRQAEIVDARLIEIEYIPHKSSSKIIDVLTSEL